MEIIEALGMVMVAGGEAAARIRAVDVLQGLEADALEEIARLAQITDVPAGKTIIEQMAPTRDVFLVLAGRVRVAIYSQAGREISFRDIDAGGSFGELAAIDGAPRSANVVAVTAARVARVAADDFMHLVEKHPMLAKSLLRQLAALVRSLSERIHDLATPVAVRVCSELLRLAEATHPEANAAVIRPAPTHAELASRVNTHREAVSRQLSMLKREGILETRRRVFVIHDLRRLAQTAQRLLDAAEAKPD
jgi:CRP-like cAMP-binding protein